LSTRSELESAVANMVFLGNERKTSLRKLALALRASPRETSDALHRLKRLGYPLRFSRAGAIERLPFRIIDAQQLRADLSTERIGRRIEWRLHVHSTQDELKKLEGEAEDGTVLLAETQYAGRGRLTRSWLSPAGGIWMSVLLRPTWPKSHQILALAFATAVARAIRAVAGVSPLLKWPNDLVVQSRKIAGVLAEASYDGSKLNQLIVGLGLNANIKTTLFPEELQGRVTSINREVGREVDRILLTRRILEETDDAYLRFESGEASELLHEVKRLCSTVGQEVEVTTVDGKFKGEALDIGEDGQLIVRLGNGATVPFYAADVAHLR